MSECDGGCSEIYAQILSERIDVLEYTQQVASKVQSSAEVKRLQ